MAVLARYKLFLALALALALACLPLNFSCGTAGYGTVRLTSDSFKNTKTFSLKLSLAPEESGIAENLRQAKLEFFRDEAAKATSLLSFIIKIDASEGDIRKEFYAKSDGIAMQLQVDDFEERRDSNPHMQTVNEFGNIGQNNTVTTIVQSKIFKLQINFTPEQESALKATTALTFRVYSGNSPINFNFSKAETKKIRNFFNGVPDEVMAN